MRKVIYFITTDNKKKEINSSATTWGELKNELGLSSSSGLKFILRETKVTLEHNDIVLPSGDITIFGMPTHNKSGADKKELIKSLHDLRRQFSLEIDTIIEEVLDGNVDEDYDEDCDDCDELAEEASEFEDL